MVLQSAMRGLMGALFSSEYREMDAVVCVRLLLAKNESCEGWIRLRWPGWWEWWRRVFVWLFLLRFALFVQVVERRSFCVL